MKILIKLSFIILLNISDFKLSACTIFCASSIEKKLMAGNEDWQDPFSKIWVHEKSKDKFGIYTWDILIIKFNSASMNMV